MLPTYSEKEICLELRHIQTAHIAPHLHASLEILLLLSETYTIGCGIDLFPMQEGDLCIIFPGLIHHYHDFDANQGKALLLLAAPSYLGAFTEVLTTKRPVTPVIAKEDVHPDIRYALSQLEALTEETAAPADMAEQALLHSFVQILLARTLPKLSLYDRTDEKNSTLSGCYLYRNTFSGGNYAPKHGKRSWHQSLPALPGLLRDLPSELQPLSE